MSKIVSTVAAFSLGLALPASASPPLAAQRPQPISPGVRNAVASVEARCPTFSWAGVDGAQGYELIVVALPEGAEQGTALQVVTRASLARGARAWTPSLGACLDRGAQYAWSVRSVAPSGERPWSEPALFRVAAGPSLEQVTAAIETLQDYLDARPNEWLPPPLAGRSGDRHGQAREPRVARVVMPRPVAGADTSPELVQAAAPVLGSASLSVSDHIALGAESNLFKEGQTFLWDDTSGNTGVGREALSLVTGMATENTAVGRGALQNTTDGGAAALGSRNTAIGDHALYSNTTGRLNTANGFKALRFNTTGFQNTASGYRALYSNTTGNFNTAFGNDALRSADSFSNTAIGMNALQQNTTGAQNTAIGAFALTANTTGENNTACGAGALQRNTTGFSNAASGLQALQNNTTGYRNTGIGISSLNDNTTGDRNTALGDLAGSNNTIGNDSIFIGNTGSDTDDQTIKIGTQGTQLTTFIAGIAGTPVTGGAVAVTASGQLGVSPSSARFKDEIETLGDVGERLAALRPVSFRYRSELVAGDGRPQLGLVAEEVAELFPELVTRDGDGRPFGVRYELLSVLLLGELQKELARNDAQEQHLEELGTRLAALEDGDSDGADAERGATQWKTISGFSH